MGEMKSQSFSSNVECTEKRAQRNAIICLTMREKKLCNNERKYAEKMPFPSFEIQFIPKLEIVIDHYILRFEQCS
uniref:Uncharacterized protein n=1 Tax=Noccaea caerulescens TaxID=107243 RepID=A0A1J3GW08_NOCCA